MSIFHIINNVTLKIHSMTTPDGLSMVTNLVNNHFLINSGKKTYNSYDRRKPSFIQSTWTFLTEYGG